MLSQKEIERAARFMRSYGEPGRGNCSRPRYRIEGKNAPDAGETTQPEAETARIPD